MEMRLPSWNHLVLALTVIVYLCLFFLIPWRFQTNDDVIIMWLVSGAYTGVSETYAVFIHPYLSWSLAQIYDAYPQFNWYGLSWYITISISVLLVLNRILSDIASPKWKAFWASFIFILGFHFCLFPQFTLVAGLAGYSGMYCLSGNRRNYLEKGISIILIVIGVMIRWESVALVMIGWVWSSFIFSIDNRKVLFQNLLLVVAIFLTLLGLKLDYEQRFVESDFLAFNKARAGVIDHPVFVESIRNEEVSRESDWFYFGRWMFEELPIDIERLKSKKIELDKQLYTWKELKNGLQRIIRVQLTELFKSMMILVLFFGVIRSSWKLDRKLLYLVVWLIFYLIFNHYNLLLGRVNLLFFLVFLFPILKKPETEKPSKFIIPGVLVLWTFLGIHSFNFWKEALGREKINKEFYFLFEKKEENSPLFLEGFFEYNYMESFNKLKPVPAITYGWISNSPFQRKAFELRGFENLNELESYSLIAFQFPEPLVFPDYIQRLGSKYEVKSEFELENLRILNFLKVR